jgi:enoyl-CoA hydratase
MTAVKDYEFLTYELIDEGAIARIMLNRPEVRNAQSRGLIAELEAAMLRAESDDTVRVVILGGHGPVFSSGHDLASPQATLERGDGPGRHPTYLVDGGTRDGAEFRMLQEWHHFFQNALRWRNLRKITIAVVQGRVLAGGLILAWACDLIVAAKDTWFADVVATRMGMCGAEYFAHPWELGARRAKELLLTGDAIDAEEAYRLGMVSKVFTGERLHDDALEFARRIAAVPTMTSLLVKESVNQSMDAMGFSNALNAAFSLHQLNHSHWAQLHDDKAPAAKPEDGVPSWRDAPPVGLAHKSSPGAVAAAEVSQ